jgi:hypothetical protein
VQKSRLAEGGEVVKDGMSRLGIRPKLGWIENRADRGFETGNFGFCKIESALVFLCRARCGVESDVEGV